ncbi:MAG TPA: hypothetical protein VGK79_06710 [Gaiellaceae bacterium]
MRLAVLTLVVALSGTGAAAPPLNVLFVGNSLTAANDLPGMVAALGAARGREIHVETRAPGGFALEDHWQTTDLPAVLARGGFDWVVMQQGPSSLPESGENLREWAGVLADAARAGGARPALLTVWPESYRSAVFGDVIANYRRAADASRSMQLPAGEAWRAALAAHPAPALYGPDGFHPSPLGTYAAAVVVVAQLTGTSPVGLPGRFQVGGRTYSFGRAAVQEVQRAAAAVTGSQTIAFARGGDIYLARLGGGRPRALVATGAAEHSPTVSPDGRKLLFVREPRAGDADLYVAHTDGTHAVQLTRARGADYTPTWSPDGGRVAFSSNRGGSSAIYVMRADGTHVRRISPAGSFTPAWSPGGRAIAFSSSARTPENPEIYTVRPDGTGLRRLTFTKGGIGTLGDDSWPAWSPDGKRIVFSSNRTGNGELWVMNADGRAQHRLAGLPGRDDWAPAYSPDGTRIAFHSFGAGGGAQLYAVRPDGAGLMRLGLAGEHPTWLAGTP